MMEAGWARGLNFRKLSDSMVTLACDETTALADIESVWGAFADAAKTTARRARISISISMSV